MSQETARRPPADFYEIQKRQSRKSLAVFALLLLFSAFALGLLLLFAWTAVSVAGGRLPFSVPGFWAKFWLADAAAAFLLAAFQYRDARRFGGAFILKRLGACPPDPSDRYHRELVNAVEAIGLAAGLPRVKAAILPDWTVNSLAVVEPDGTPVVAVTEGLLAEFARDEVEAVVAHEIAHIARGDTFVLTLVCAAANTFERLREALEPDVDVPAGTPGAGARAGGSALGALAGLSAAVVKLLAVLVSRERERLADAAAVELGRSPEALGRALYKAHIHNSFVGDFNRTYGPLFIVAPQSRREEPGPLARFTSTHPPTMERIRILAEMAHKTSRDLIAATKDMGVERDRAKYRFPAFAEIASRPAVAASPADLAGNSGPGRCPRCAVPLADSFYEGVPIKICRSCLGKLVPQDRMDRILARTEIGFSEALLKRADEFAATATRNPLKNKKAALPSRQDRLSRTAKPALPSRQDRLSRTAETAAGCPECGYRLASRPYNYQYFLPVERCLNCGRIWFDADELEILQILVERAKKS